MVCVGVVTRDAFGGGYRFLRGLEVMGEGGCVVWGALRYVFDWGTFSLGLSSGTLRDSSLGFK